MKGLIDKIKLFINKENEIPIIPEGELYPKYFKNQEDIDFSPIFLLGGNRTGTSLTSSIVAQHPQLEGIFESGDKKVNVSNTTGHTDSYCSSHHVWKHLAPLSDDWFNQNEGVLWGHPKHISKYYRDKPKNKSEELFLANGIQSYRHTDKIPFINSHFNMFRIGLITKIFPNAKFIMTIRDFKDYIKSCYHKWSSQNINIEFPKIGLHWFTLNSCCLYDLKKYAPKNHCIVDYRSLFGNYNSVNNMLNIKLKHIGLDNFDFNLDSIKTSYRFLENKFIDEIEYSEIFEHLESLISFENDITS